MSRDSRTRVYDLAEARDFLVAEGIDVDAVAPQVEGTDRASQSQCRDSHAP